MLLRDANSAWGIEADYVGRSKQLHNGGFPRMVYRPAIYRIRGYLPGQRPRRQFSMHSQWTTDAQNHIIAGPIGGRWFKKLGRWMLSTEGRGLAGLNCQNVHQFGFIGSNIQPGGLGSGNRYHLGPTDINHNEFIRQLLGGPGVTHWTPDYQITRSVSFPCRLERLMVEQHRPRVRDDRLHSRSRAYDFGHSPR